MTTLNSQWSSYTHALRGIAHELHQQTRQFCLSPEQEELLAHLRAQLAASSTKEAVLRAAQLTSLLLNEMQHGNRLFVGKSPASATRVVIPGLDAPSSEQWRWLVERPHPWRRQLWVKGRKLLASAVWLDALTNGMGTRITNASWRYIAARIRGRT